MDVALEHSNHIVKLGVDAYVNTSSPDVYWKKTLNWQDHLELCHSYPGTLYNAKPDCIIHFNCEEVHTQCKL